MGMPCVLPRMPAWVLHQRRCLRSPLCRRVCSLTVRTLMRSRMTCACHRTSQRGCIPQCPMPLSIAVVHAQVRKTAWPQCIPQALVHGHTCMQLPGVAVWHGATRSMSIRRPAAQRPRHTAAGCRGSCRTASCPSAHAARALHAGSRGGSRAPAERPASRAAVPARTQKYPPGAVAGRSLQKRRHADSAVAMCALQA